MEGKKSSLNRDTIAIIVIILFHIVGLTGFFISAARPLFLHIVPFHLLLMLLVMGYSYSKPVKKFIQFGVIIYGIGFIAEWIGVHKNWIFGDYHYGRTLGLSLYDIPLTMGLNWFLLVYAAGVTLQRSPIKWWPVRVILGALILVLLDVLIEPIAQRFDYWHWTDNIVPFKNYLGWFAVSIVCLLLFEAFKFNRKHWAAVVLLVVQFIFFGLLQLV